MARRLPEHGEHTKEVLAEFGFPDKEIAELTESGVAVAADEPRSRL